MTLRSLLAFVFIAALAPQALHAQPNVDPYFQMTGSFEHPTNSTYVGTRVFVTDFVVGIAKYVHRHAGIYAGAYLGRSASGAHTEPCAMNVPGCSPRARVPDYRYFGALVGGEYRHNRVLALSLTSGPGVFSVGDGSQPSGRVINGVPEIPYYPSARLFGVNTHLDGIITLGQHFSVIPTFNSRIIPKFRDRWLRLDAFGVGFRIE